MDGDAHRISPSSFVLRHLDLRPENVMGRLRSPTKTNLLREILISAVKNDPKITQQILLLPECSPYEFNMSKYGRKPFLVKTMNRKKGNRNRLKLSKQLNRNLISLRKFEIPQSPLPPELIARVFCFLELQPNNQNTGLSEAVPWNPIIPCVCRQWMEALSSFWMWRNRTMCFTTSTIRRFARSSEITRHGFLCRVRHAFCGTVALCLTELADDLQRRNFISSSNSELREFKKYFSEVLEALPSGLKYLQVVDGSNSLRPMREDAAQRMMADLVSAIPLDRISNILRNSVFKLRILDLQICDSVAASTDLEFTLDSLKKLKLKTSFPLAFLHCPTLRELVITNEDESNNRNLTHNLLSFLVDCCSTITNVRVRRIAVHREWTDSGVRLPRRKCRRFQMSKSGAQSLEESLGNLSPLIEFSSLAELESRIDFLTTMTKSSCPNLKTLSLDWLCGADLAPESRERRLNSFVKICLSCPLESLELRNCPYHLPFTSADIVRSLTAFNLSGTFPANIISLPFLTNLDISKSPQGFCPGTHSFAELNQKEILETFATPFIRKMKIRNLAPEKFLTSRFYTSNENSDQFYRLEELHILTLTSSNNAFDALQILKQSIMGLRSLSWIYVGKTNGTLSGLSLNGILGILKFREKRIARPLPEWAEGPSLIFFERV